VNQQLCKLRGYAQDFGGICEEEVALVVTWKAVIDRRKAGNGNGSYKKTLPLKGQESSNYDSRNRVLTEFQLCSCAGIFINSVLYSSDQVVVATSADLFDIKKALSTDKSAQLVGSMTAESLRHIIERRYQSRLELWSVTLALLKPTPPARTRPQGH
jgi:hypothetical protein